MHNAYKIKIILNIVPKTPVRDVSTMWAKNVLPLQIIHHSSETKNYSKLMFCEANISRCSSSHILT